MSSQGKIVSITFEYGAIKALVSRGREVLAHALTTLDRDFFHEGLVTHKASAARILGQALEGIVPKGARVVGTAPGFHSTLRLLELPKARGLDASQFIPLEAAKTMGISVQTSHLLWHRLPDNLDRMRWLVMSATRRSVASFLDVAGTAGLRVRALDMRPFALARVANQLEAIIAWVAPDGCDVVVVKRWAPVAYQNLTWEPRPVDANVLVERLTEMMARTTASYDRSHPGDPVSDDAPLHFFGSEEDLPAECGPQIAGNLGRPIGEWAVPLKCPDDLPAQDFVVNMGLALREA